MQLNFKYITPKNLLLGCIFVAGGALVLAIFPWLFLKTYIASDEEVKSWDKGTAADEAMMLSWKGQRTDYVQYLRESTRSVAGWWTVFGLGMTGGGLFYLKPIFKKSEPADNQTPQTNEPRPEPFQTEITPQPADNQTKKTTSEAIRQAQGRKRVSDQLRNDEH